MSYDNTVKERLCLHVQQPYDIELCCYYVACCDSNAKLPLGRSWLQRVRTQMVTWLQNNVLPAYDIRYLIRRQRQPHLALVHNMTASFVHLQGTLFGMQLRVLLGWMFCCCTVLLWHNTAHAIEARLVIYWLPIVWDDVSLHVGIPVCCASRDPMYSELLVEPATARLSYCAFRPLQPPE